MNNIDHFVQVTSIADLNLYQELGNEAAKSGDVEGSITWYMKGLSIARELKNTEQASVFSSLLVTLF